MTRALWVALAAVLVSRSAHADWPADANSGLPVCAAAGDQFLQRMIPDGAGGCWLTWTDQRLGATDQNIFAHHVLATGVVDPAFPADGLLVCGTARTQSASVLASDAVGGVFVAWWDQFLSVNNPDLYAQHVRANATLDPGWPVAGAVIRNTLDFQNQVEILADGEGGFWAVFGNINPTNDVFVQRLTAAGTRMAGWPEFGLMVSALLDNQFSPKMVLDGAGGALVAWRDERAAGIRFAAMRVHADGTMDPAWTPGGVTIATILSTTTTSLSIQADGAGGFYAAWNDGAAAGAHDVRAQHVRGDGTLDPAWPAAGVVLCNAPGDQTQPQLIRDGLGNLLVVWMDKRGADLDLYGTRLLASGAPDPALPANGVPLCAVSGDVNLSPRMVVPDPAGGCWVAWEDLRSVGSSRDVYATHLLASGQPDPQWPTNGRAVCTGAGIQNNVGACAGGAGTLLVSWADRRTGTGDIAVQRVNPDGTLDAPPVTVGSRVALAPPQPNPAASGVRLHFDIPAGEAAVVEIHDLAGRLVRSSEALASGQREWTWDTRDGAGEPVMAGLYWVRLNGRSGMAMRRVTVLR